MEIKPQIWNFLKYNFKHGYHFEIWHLLSDSLAEIYEGFTQEPEAARLLHTFGKYQVYEFALKHK